MYIPNGQAVGSEKYAFKLAWMQRLREFFDSNYDPKTPVLLCGDFNVAPEERDVHDIRLWQGRIMFSEQEHAALQHIKVVGLYGCVSFAHGGWRTFHVVGLPRRRLSTEPRTADRSHLDQ